ncbi:MAG: hypothetical protein ISR55_03250 [Bacteroidetes bacterium]|nr:hypothetical protein [Bacteroidota bacterium]MBL6962812.1 hypothetical protein [Bacteroidota bacterium]
MKKQIFIFLFSFSTLSAAFCQADLTTVETYWGKVSSFKVSPDQLKAFNRIYVFDTILKREISEISKFRFIVQPVMDGPVKIAETTGNELSLKMRTFIENPKPGDRIIVSEIFAYVNGEGFRQIPTAIVFVVE